MSDQEEIFSSRQLFCQAGSKMNSDFDGLTQVKIVSESKTKQFSRF